MIDCDSLFPSVISSFLSFRPPSNNFFKNDMTWLSDVFLLDDNVKHTVNGQSLSSISNESFYFLEHMLNNPIGATIEIVYIDVDWSNNTVCRR